MKIALFDYIVTPDNAIGKCNRAIVGGLCDEHDFTVFSVEFENPAPAVVAKRAAAAAPPRANGPELPFSSYGAG